MIDFKDETVRIMRDMGGSFASRIADAWRVADEHNRRRLENAFPDLFERYRAMLETLGEKL